MDELRQPVSPCTGCATERRPELDNPELDDRELNDPRPLVSARRLVGVRRSKTRLDELDEDERRSVPRLRDELGGL